MPDEWLGLFTPWVPMLLLMAGALIWAGALARSRQASARGDTATPQPAR